MSTCFIPLYTGEKLHGHDSVWLTIKSIKLYSRVCESLAEIDDLNKRDASAHTKFEVKTPSIVLIVFI